MDNKQLAEQYIKNLAKNISEWQLINAQYWPSHMGNKLFKKQ